MIRIRPRNVSVAIRQPEASHCGQRVSNAAQRLSLLTLTVLGLSLLTGSDRAVVASSDDKAESLYSKMAEQIRSAKSLQIVCQGSFKTAGFEAEVKATLLLKEGNKMRLELDTSGWRDGEPYSYGFRMLSDGTRIRMSERKQPWQEFQSNPRWNDIVAANITRGGFPSGLELARAKERGKSEDAVIGFRPVALPTDFVLWSKEKLNGKEVLPIEFKGKNESEFQRDTTTILWLTTDTGLPAKRMIVVRTDRTLTVTETYNTFTLNEPIEDSSFSFPKEE